MGEWWWWGLVHGPDRWGQWASTLSLYEGIKSVLLIVLYWREILICYHRKKR
jgi:hypothetical protein